MMAFQDSREPSIFRGTSETMKQIIGRGIVADPA